MIKTVPIEKLIELELMVYTMLFCQYGFMSTI
jgi:hypothetical protein